MQFLDLIKDNKVINKKLFNQVMNSGQYLMGNYQKKLEETFPYSVGFKYGVTFKNATDAISVLIGELLKEKSSVICPNFTAYPPAVAIRSKTKQIYYVDVDDTMTIDCSKLPDIKNSIVFAVNLFGNNANIETLRNYCKSTNSILVEDCAQSTGSEILPRVSDFAVYSFYPTKPLGSMGDGGMICFNDEKWIEIFSTIRFYGQKNGTVERLGINSRMDEWQCAVVLEKMKTYRNNNKKRIEIATRYKKIINGIFVHSKCVYHQFPVLFKDREKIKLNIPYMIHYPHHVTDMPILRGKYNKVGFRVNDKIVSLPVHPFLKENDICRVEEFLYENKTQGI